MIDLRSDTVTKPTPAMLRAMAEAEVGDDQREGDPTTRKLEATAAELLGMDGGLYVPSGTMANLIAVLVHTRDRRGLVLEASSHMATVEAQGIATLTQARTYPVRGAFGVMASDDVQAAFDRAAADGISVGLFCVENTHNSAGGTLLTESEMKRLISLGRDRGAAVHVDGARIFNASVALGTPAARLVEGADSAMFCISKGLGAPVGSVLCGRAYFVAAAKQARMWCGGAMRQSGVIAAAGIVGLKDYPERFVTDHANARRLAEGLSKLPLFEIDMRSVQTNMVYVRVANPEFDPTQFERYCYERGIRVRANKERFRFVLHHQISSKDVDKTVEVIEQFTRSCLPPL
ncbi:MAG: aminotransferase class I/II-fold pyridoxal phosphate-dependent enzyme [Deltaproteobacteria bacterium]|nr:aminotransferase class I/II-fold pyridoxal phosphate-dependent enzyme [Deltaproteobacteria bacterium]